MVGGGLLENPALQVAYGKDKVGHGAFALEPPANLRNGEGECIQHSHKGPHGVGTKENIMQKHKELEDPVGSDWVGSGLQGLEVFFAKASSGLFRDVGLF